MKFICVFIRDAKEAKRKKGYENMIWPKSNIAREKFIYHHHHHTIIVYILDSFYVCQFDGRVVNKYIFI